MYKTGTIIESWTEFVGFVGLESAALVVGSDLPDIDAKSAPIHKLYLVLVPGSVILIFLGPVGFSLRWASIAAALSLLAFLRLMPPHRRFIRTIRAGLMMAGVLAGLLVVLVGFPGKIGLWTGLSLFLGHVIHLWKDGWVRI